MTECTVKGFLTAQIKLDSLVGKKLLVCQPMNNPKGLLVAADMVGAGVGSQVLVARNYAPTAETRGIDSLVVAILDSK